MSELKQIQDQCIALGHKISGKLGLSIDVALTNSFVPPEESWLLERQPLPDTTLPLAITIRIQKPSHMQVKNDAMTIAREEFANLIIANDLIHGVTLGDVSQPQRLMRIYLNSDFVCTEHPELLIGQPIGFYNCPKCSMPVVAGSPHPTPDREAATVHLFAVVEDIAFNTLSGWTQEINFSISEQHPHSIPHAFKYLDAADMDGVVEYKHPMAVPIAQADDRLIDLHINIHRGVTELSKTLTQHLSLIHI